jgi:hypothetical protein
MNPACAGSEQLTIEHKRKPGQRMPVGREVGGKSPFDIVESQTAYNMLIFVYIQIVIVMDKIEIPDLPEDKQSADC